MTDIAPFLQFGLFDFVPEAERADLTEKLARRPPSQWEVVGELLRFRHADAESLHEAGVASEVARCEDLLAARGVKLHVVRAPLLGGKSLVDDVYVRLPAEGWAIIEDESHGFAREPDPELDSCAEQLDECIVRVGRHRFGLALGEGDDAWARVSRGFCAIVRWLLSQAGGAAARESVHSLRAGSNDHHVFFGSRELAAALAAHGAPISSWPELDRTPNLHAYELSPTLIGESELGDVRRFQADAPPRWLDYVEDSALGKSAYVDDVVYVGGSGPVDSALVESLGIDAAAVFVPRDEHGRARGYVLVKTSDPAASRAVVQSLHDRDAGGTLLIAQTAPRRQLRFLAQHFELPASFTPAP